MPASPHGRSDSERLSRPYVLRRRASCPPQLGGTRTDDFRALPTESLLSLLMTGGRHQRAVRGLVRRILSDAGSVKRIANWSVQEFAALGVDWQRAVSIVAAFELGRRLQKGVVVEPSVIRSAADVAARFSSKLRDRNQEEFWTLLLSSAGTVINEVRITVGTLTASLVHPRECFHPAVKEPAASVIFVHNHPSGNPEPSREDRLVTRQLVEAGVILGIPVLDHVIIGGHQYMSFAERGLVQQGRATMA